MNTVAGIKAYKGLGHRQLEKVSYSLKLTVKRTAN